MSRLAKLVQVDEVLDQLRDLRTLYHSEADLQHSFALAIARLAPDLRIRLEVPLRQERSEYLDILVEDPSSGASTAVELKYITQRLET